MKRPHSLGRGRPGKFDGDDRPSSRGTLNGDVPAVGLDQALCRRQPETRSAGFGGEEGREDLFPDVRRNARAVIGKRDLAFVRHRRVRTTRGLSSAR